MAITHPVTAVRNAMADAVVDRVDLGTTNASGRLILLTAADGVVATLPMSNPAYGAAASGTATAGAITSDTNTAAGVVAKFKVTDRDNATVYASDNVTATAGGGDLELSSLTFGAGDTANITSFTYSAPV